MEGNYNTRFGEIDLIMTDGDNLVFIVLRQCTSNRFGTTVETVNKQKRQCLHRAAADYLQRTHRNNGGACRFDVIAIEAARANA